ncbi:MAG TPA: acyltransferase [Sphingomonadaceae bacterium]|nr:acyltransferase [Sphingomonadaceae bacterium]
MRTIESLAKGRDNNFNLIRVVAATAVLVSHAWPIALGPGVVEPLETIAPTNLGRLAVAVFFAVSGFFITKSFDRRESFIAFGVARVLRLFPGLIVVLLLTLFLLGPAFTHLALSDYFGSWRTWTYVPHNLLLFRLQYDLPETFTANPIGPAINGSLWTLWYEVSCYGGVVVLGFAGLLRRRRFPLFLLAYALLYSALRMRQPGLPPAPIMELSLPFVTGACFYVFGRYLPLSLGGVALLAGLAFLLRETMLYREAFILALAYAVFWVGHLEWPLLRSYNRLGDYSYGMYIFAFPIEQSIVALVPGIAPGALIVAALGVTIPCAIASWHWIEHPALAQRHRVGHRLTLSWNGVRRQPAPLPDPAAD